MPKPAQSHESVRTGTFMYVPHPEAAAFMRRGWMVVSHLGRVHGHYSVLMWRCGCGVAL